MLRRTGKTTRRSNPKVKVVVYPNLELREMIFSLILFPDENQLENMAELIKKYINLTSKQGVSASKKGNVPRRKPSNTQKRMNLSKSKNSRMETKSMLITYLLNNWTNKKCLLARKLRNKIMGVCGTTFTWRKKSLQICWDCHLYLWRAYQAIFSLSMSWMRKLTIFWEGSEFILY